MGTINQPTAAPTRKVAAAGIGIPLSTLIIWGLQAAGIPVPAEVGTAIGGLISSALAYFVKERA